MTVFDLIIIPLVLILGHFIINLTVKRFDILQYKLLLIRLFYYHLAFTLLYAWYVFSFGGDAIGYWGLTRLHQFMRSGSFLELHMSGTPFMYLVVYPLVKILKLSYWGTSIVFTLFGFGGIIFLFLTMLRTLKSNIKIWGVSVFPLILFLPNMHFWSGGIGKDSIIFFALTLFIFSLTKPSKNVPGILIGLYLAYMVRPHIALLMIIGMIFGLATSTSGLSTFWRLTLLTIAVYIFVMISPSVLEFIGIEESIDSLDELSQVRSKNLSRGSVGSSIDLSSYSLPLKLFTFLFRPLFFDVGNVFGLVVSFENLFYVILFIKAVRFNFFMRLFTMPAHLKASFIVLAAATYFMSSSLSNLGIIIRQKNMVMFMFVLVMLHLLSEASEKSTIRLPKRILRSPSYAKARTR